MAFLRNFFLSLLILLNIFFINRCTSNQIPMQMEITDQVSDQYVKSADKMAKDGQFKTSNFFLKKAINTYENMGIWDKAIKCYIKLGDNFQRLDDVSSALGALNLALDVSKNQLGFQNLELANSFQKLAFKYLQERNFDRALELYEKALAIQLEVLGRDHPEVSKTYNSIALIYWHKKQPLDADKSYQKSYSIKLRQFAGMPKDVDKKFHIIDGVIYKKGKFRKARDHFNRTVVEYKKLYGQNKPLFARLYEQIGILYALEGNYESALEYIRKAFNIRLQIYGDFTLEASTGYLNIGICLRLKGDYEESIKFLNDALRIKNEYLGEFHPETADIYFQLGKVYYQQLQLDEAISFFQRSLIALVPDFDDSRVTSNPPLGMMSPTDKLLESLIAKADTLRLKYLYHPEQIESLNTAYSTYILVSQVIETLRRGYKSDNYKLFFGEKVHSIYQEAIQTSLLLYDITEEVQYKKAAFILSEKGKATVLEEALCEAKARKFSGIPSSLLQKEKQLRKDLTFFDTYLQKEYFREKPNTERINSLEEQYYSLVLEYLKLIDNFETNYKKYYELKYKPLEINIDKIQKYLSHDSAIIEYFIGEGVLHIFVLTDKGLEFRDIVLDEDLNRLVADYNRAIKKIEEGPFLLLSWKLYRLLFEPVRHLIKQKKKLIIIPDGPLYTIPYESLISGQTGTSDLSKRDFLVKHFAFSYHYSAYLWLASAIENSPLQDTSFIGFAPVFGQDIRNGYIIANNPTSSPSDKNQFITSSKFRNTSGEPLPAVSQLPATEEELRAIIELFRIQGKKALGYFHRKATEDNFKNAKMVDYNLIHIATHSIKNEGPYQLSGLIFSPPESGQKIKEDGILYSGEIYNLQLNAELIVLSSCESGVGKLVKGEGMIALNRGFFYSGIKNIVYSLWKVEDRSTSRLMIAFYKNILQGCSYSLALQKAKLELIEDRFTAFPKYWSGFVLVGR